MMDPNHRDRDRGQQPDSRRDSTEPGPDPTPGPVDGVSVKGRSPAAADRQPRSSGGFTMIPPNQTRHHQLTTVAQKEEQELQRWREAHRVTAVHTDPERLGGNVTMSEARQKQFTDHRCSKPQKKLKKEEMDRRRRREEEEEYEKMKAQQREKAERLQERRQQEEQRRSERLSEDHLRTTRSFLQRFESAAPGPVPVPSSSATRTPASRRETVEDKHRERQRVNSAFLDKLQGRGSDAEAKHKQDPERPDPAAEDFTQQTMSGHLAHLNPDRDRDQTEAAGPEPDFDWALMKLMSSFPNYDKDFLEDILAQCSGDYQEAYTLLVC